MTNQTRQPAHQLDTRLLWGGVIALLLVIAFLLPNLADYSMRNDEVLTVRAAMAFDLSHGYSESFLAWQLAGHHPPLYFMLLNGWMRLAGLTDIALRTLTLFTSLLTAALGLRLAADISRSRWGGLAAALIFGSMGFVIYYTHQAHNYSLLMLTATLALFTTRRFWLRPTRARSVAAMLATLALIGAHYYGIYAVLALNVYALARGMRDPRRWLRWIYWQAIAALLYVPWLPIIGYHYAHAGGRDPIGYPTNWATIWRTVGIMLSEQVVLYGGLLVVGLAAAWWGRAGLRRRWRGDVALLVWFIVGSLCFALLVNIKLLTFVDRRMIYLLPPFAVLLAVLLVTVPRRVGIALAGVAVLIGLLAGWSPRLMGNWFYRHGVEALVARLDPGDTTYLDFHPPFDDHIIRYYADRLLPEGDTGFTVPELDLRNPFLMDDFMDRVWLRDHFWVMRPTEHDPSEWTVNLPNRYALAEAEDVYWFTLERYDVVDDDRPQEPVSAPLEDAAPLPATFGDMLQLADYGVDRVTVQPGEAITLWVDWQAVQPPDEDYAVFVHLLADDGQTLYGSADSDPSHLGRTVPTRTWPPERVIHDGYTITVDPATPPGTYTLRIGFYSRERPLRLPVALPDGQAATPGDSLPLAAITVTE